MAYCWKDCPYFWRDEDNEYCSARENEVISGADYSYDTCIFYQDYLRNKPKKDRKGGNLTPM